jgi:hypothetical protein
MVPIQTKNFMPVGTAIRKLRKLKNGSSTWIGGEHVVRPHTEGQHPDQDRRRYQPFVAEHRLAAEHRNDLGDDAEERQRDDVHLGVTEEPEQVLPQHRPAGRHVEDMRTEHPVGGQREQRRRQEREHHDDQQAGDEDVPREDRQPEHRHAGCAQRQDGGDDVDGAEDGAQT